MPNKSRKYGYIPDDPDSRDQLYRAPSRLALSLPPKVDLWPDMAIIPIEDQRQTSSCVGNSTARAMEFVHDCTGQANCLGTHEDVSRMFIYYGARWIGKAQNQDAGCQIRDAIKVLARNGTCREEIWPFKEALLYTQPNEMAFKDALKRRARDYKRVVGLDDLKAALAQRFPVVFGFTVYSSFESDAVAKTGKVPLPKTRGLFRERILGGHAILATGYDDNMLYLGSDGKTAGAGCVLFDNSWGPGWGMAGRGAMPYPMIASPSITSDCWTITGVDYK